MSLSFLPEVISSALSHLNFNRLSEIRLRQGQPVIAEYDGKYVFIGGTGIAATEANAVRADDMASVLNAATGGSIYGYTEQIKNGFITVGHGVRIGIAGEYVTERGAVTTIKNVTSLNIRIPHDVKGCANSLFESLFKQGAVNALIFSKPGLGKTTMLREIARKFGKTKNVLIFDERGEIAAMDGYGEGYDLGCVDVVRCYSKLGAISSAIRAMKPDVIITDELYGADDIAAVQYASDCSIAVIASSHITDRNKLKTLPFEYYIELKNIGGTPVIYDKNFNSYCNRNSDNNSRRIFVDE